MWPIDGILKANDTLGQSRLGNKNVVHILQSPRTEPQQSI